ncbi:S9 family peptidase [Pseudoneobacillus sp. C159]
MRLTEKGTLETFLAPSSMPVFTVNKDETSLYFCSNQSGGYNLWKMDLADKSVQRITNHNQKMDCIVASDPIYLTCDENGNELMKIYSVNQDGENWQAVRNDENVRYFFGGISENGEKLYYTSSKDNPIYLSIFSYDIATGTETLLHKGSGAETHLLSVSPNGQDVAYFVRYNHSNMKIYLKKDGQDTELIKEPKSSYRVSNLVFLTEDKVLFTTDYLEEFSYLAGYDLLTGEFEKIMAIENQDIEKIQFDLDGEILLETKVGPIGELYRYDLKDQELKKIALPTDTILQWMVTPKGTIYLAGSSANKPITLYCSRNREEWETLVDNEVPFFSESDLVKPELVKYTSFDGTEIEAMFYKTKEENWNGHTIIYSHGGPQYNEQADYFGFFQYLLASGYHIFAPNFRGTPNYGTTFLKMIEGDWGGGPRMDVLEGIDHLVKEGKVEADKLVLFGASYGGYLSLLLFGRHQERFKACVNIFGPTNLLTLIETCPDHWKERMNSWIGNPIKDRDRLIEQSPISYVKNFSKPLFIMQGANDPRVKKSESDQIVEACNLCGADYEYVFFDDEGHGFSKKENELKAFQAIASFLEKVISK